MLRRGERDDVGVIVRGASNCSQSCVVCMGRWTGWSSFTVVNTLSRQLSSDLDAAVCCHPDRTSTVLSVQVTRCILVMAKQYNIILLIIAKYAIAAV